MGIRKPNKNSHRIIKSKEKINGLNKGK